MGHEEEIKNYPMYWNRVRDTLGPLILDILNNKQLINEDKNDRLTIENVVRMKKIMSKITSENVCKVYALRYFVVKNDVIFR